jgi:hypothetical protein
MPTAVSLASVSPISSWVGVEIGYIAAQYTALGIKTDPFVACIQVARPPRTLHSGQTLQHSS